MGKQLRLQGFKVRLTTGSRVKSWISSWAQWAVPNHSLSTKSWVKQVFLNQQRLSALGIPAVAYSPGI